MLSIHNKIASIAVVTLLLTVVVTAGPFFTLPANATLDPNSVALHSAPNTMTRGNTHMIFLPIMHRILHSSALVSGNSLTKLGATSIGSTPGNISYCFVGTCSNLTSHGGPVMHNAKLLVVFWVGGSFSDCSTSHYFEDSTNDASASSPNDCSYMNLQTQFLKDACSDPYMQIAAQYADGSGGAGPCIVAPSLAGKVSNPWVDTRAFPEATLTDSDIQTEAQRAVTQMGYTFDGNTQVYVFLPYSTPSCFDSSFSECFGSYCAYHGWNGAILYASMPDAARAGAGCGLIVTSPNSDPVADTEISPLSHELMESITDPSGMGWYYTDTGHEIGDECAYGYGTTSADGSDVLLGKHGDPYIIQTEWSNTNHGCTLSEQSLPAPPTTPTGISANPISSGSIGLSWTASTGATSYNVFRSTSASGPFTTFVSSPATTSYTDTRLSPSTSYYYELTASNSGGTSRISGDAFASTAIAAPPPPTIGTPVAVNSTAITVSWTASAGATSYNVYRSTLSTGPFTTPLGSSPSSPYVDNTLSPNTKYFYKVSAVNVGGESALSAAASATTTPITPTGFTVTTTSASASLTWTASPGATSYKIYREIAVQVPGSIDPFTLVGTSTLPSFTNTGLTPNTQFFYEVTALNVGGESPRSSQVFAFTAPPIPTGVAAAPINSTAITTSWTAAPGAGGYHVYRSTLSTGPFTTPIASPPSSPYVDNTLSPNTKYFYAISSVNEGGSSVPSTPAVSATTAPAAPTNVTPTALSSTSIKITWTASPGATSYHVFRSTSAAGPFTTPISSPTTSFTDTGLDPGFQYYYEISAVNANGESPNSTPPATTLTLNVPPTGVSVTEASQTELALTWGVPEGSVTVFNVYHATSAAGPFTLAGPSATSSFVDTGLLSGKQYFYEVTTLDGGGESIKSTPIASGFTIPPTPTGITATPTSPNSIALSWTASTGATSYNVYRSTSAAGPFSTPIASPPTTSFTDTGLAPNTAYYYEISAVDSGGASPSSNPATSAITLPTPPTAPTGVTASPISATSIQVTWNVSEGASVYTEYRSTSPSGPFTNPVHKTTIPPDLIGKQTGITLTTFTDTGLAPNTAYYYKIRASNTGGTSPYSSAATTSTLPLPPAAPTGVTATALSSSSIKVSWTGSSSATVYSIFISSSSSGPFDTQIGTSTISPFTDTGLSSGTKYYYQVSASNSGGVSLDSATASASTIPGAPTGLSASSPTTSTSVSLTWTAPTGATSYKIYRETVPLVLGKINPFTVVGTSMTPSFTNTGLTPNTQYAYEVSALDTGGESALSSSTLALTAPATPTGVAATTVNSTAISVSWTASTGATSYNVYRSTSAAGPFTTPIALSPSSPYVDNTLSPNTKYFYKVSAVNVGGESALSAAASATTTPITPVEVVAHTISSSSIGLTWFPSTGATSYKIYRSTSAAGPFTTLVGTVMVTSFTDTTGLSPNTGYYYEVSALNIGGQSPLSSATSAFTAPPIPTGVAAADTLTGSITISWNPSAGALSYNVFRSTLSTGPFTTPLGSSPSSPYVDSTPLPNTKYFYEVSSVNEGGSSVPSTPPVSAITAPVAPTNVIPTALSSTSIKITWTASPGATSYKIYRDTSPTFATSTQVGTSTTTSFTNTGLTPSATYYYEVKASNANGDSALSGGPIPATATPAHATTLPAQPTNVRATTLSTSSISITWSPSAGATSYNIFRATSLTGPFTTSAGTSTVTSFNDTGLTPHVTYYYEVKAVGTGGSSIPSTPASAFTGPTIYLSPTSGHVGTSVTVTGILYSANATVTFKFDNTGIGNTVKTDSSGHFITSFKVPTIVAGSYTVSAVDTKYNAALAVFNVN